MSDAKWYYDEQGYFKYLLLPRSFEGYYDEIEKALLSKGIQVTKKNYSFRPASDGIQYNWYFRVEGESNILSKTKINAVVRAVLKKKQRLTKTSLQEEKKQDIALPQEAIQKKADDTSQSLKESLNRIETIEKELFLRNIEVETLKAKYQKEIASKNNKMKELEISLRSSKEENDVLNSKIQERLESQTKDKLESEYKAIIENKDKEIFNFKIEIEKKEKELNDYISEFDNELKQREMEIAHLRQEKCRLQNDNTTIFDKMHKDSSLSDRKNLVTSIIEVLMPNVIFVRSSIEMALIELSDQEIINAIKSIHNIINNQIDGWRVEGQNKGWKEYHSKAVKWRVYFRQLQNEQYEVLLSGKDSQEGDIQWMKRTVIK